MNKNSHVEVYNAQNPLPKDIVIQVENRLEQKIDAQTEMVEVLEVTVRYRVRKRTESWGLSGNILVLPKKSATSRNGC